MNLTEKFDASKLNYILQNREKFKVREYDDTYDAFLMPFKYLQKSTKGIIKVSYHQPKNRNFGRFFADNGLSMQNMVREIRHTISAEFYDDLDIVNAHPIILQFLCRLHNIDCERLDEYIENREKHLKDLKIPRDDAKQVFLSIINGGEADYKKLVKPTPFIKKFKREMIDILEDLADLHPTEKEIRTKSNPDNVNGSTVNAIMCDWENRIIQFVLKFYQDKGIMELVGVLSFDGLMMPKHKDTEGLIPECEAYVFEKTGITIQLKIKPMTEGFDLPDDLPEPLEYTNFDPRDNFCWLDFDDKWRGKSFVDENEIIEATRIDLNRVFCRVEQGTGFIVKKTDCNDNLFDIIDRNSGFSDMYFKYGEGDKVKEMGFKRYLQVFSGCINRYRNIDFAPNNNDKALFNLWSGFKAQLSQSAHSCELILSHIKEVYCDGCEESYEYFLDLIYYILKYPEKPLCVATFIYSRKQGSGKNIILDFLEEFVFGKPITHCTTGLESVLEKHNHLLKSKKIVVVDELASTSDNFIGNFDKLKSMMTSSSLVINPKGVNQYSIKNVLAWFLISNHDDCLRLEPTDRRYFCLSVSEKYVGNKDYFKKLSNTFNQDTGNAFYTYILERGDNRDINIRIPPMNKFKKEMISKSWSSSIRYLFDIKDDEFDDPDESLITATTLYSQYTNWCSFNHERVKTSSKFYADIKTNIEQKRTQACRLYDLKTITL